MAGPAREQSWAERAEAKLAQEGYRRGGARRALLALLERQSCALSAIEIERALARGKRRVGRASVYRNLEQLERLRLVQRVEIGQAMVRFERVGSDEGHHHHLVCDRCGLITPFVDEALEGAIRRISERVPLEVSEHEIVLHGSCAACQA